MEYVEQYLQVVKKYLWFKQDEDYIEQLRNQIEHALDGDHSQQKISTVLEGFGDPKQLARKYNYQHTKLQITGLQLNAIIKLIQFIAIIGLFSMSIASLGIIVDLKNFSLLFTFESIIRFSLTVIANTINFTLIGIGLIAVCYFLVQNNILGSKEYLDYLLPLTGLEGDKRWSIKKLTANTYLKIDYLTDSLSTIIFTGVFLIVLKIQPWPAQFNFFNYQFYNQLTVLLVIAIAIELAINSYRFFKGCNDLSYLCLEIFKQSYGVFITLYILIDQQMFYIPQVLPMITDDIFNFIVVISIISAIGSVMIVVYKYIKHK